MCRSANLSKSCAIFLKLTPETGSDETDTDGVTEIVGVLVGVGFGVPVFVGVILGVGVGVEVGWNVGVGVGVIWGAVVDVGVGVGNTRQPLNPADWG